MDFLRSVARSEPYERAWAPMSQEDEDDPMPTWFTFAEDDPRSARSYTSESEEPASSRDDPECGYEAVKDMTVDLPLEPLPETIYGFVMASLIKDSSDLMLHSGLCMNSLKPCRIFGAFLLCMVMFGLQGFFIMEAKRLVTPRDVARAREVYGLFEDAMYTDDSGISHTYKTSNGHARGMDGYFNETRFDALPKEEKEFVCRIPLSQPHFLFGVLLIWTLTVMYHFRMTFNLFLRIVALPHLPTMDGALKPRENGGVEVMGLTCWMKAALILCVQCPRVIMNSILLWLGARWLTATLGFGDLLLNALALEFILNLSSLLYLTLVPYSGKMMVLGTFIPHVGNDVCHIARHERENCCNMFGMFGCGILAAALVMAYMYVPLQRVLPGYRWDVHVVCQKFLEKELAV